MEDVIQRSLFFVAPYRVSVTREAVRSPDPGELLVETTFSSISAGTELLIYRNLFPRGVPVDDTIPNLRRKFAYPIKYGYSAVGQVIGCGANVSKWKGKSVFSFHPHESHFLAVPEEIVALPPDLPLNQAALLPSIETSIHLLSDGLPMIGERVVVFGQGTIGLITTALLARMDLGSLITLDNLSMRREASLSMGAHVSLDPQKKNIQQLIKSLLKRGDQYEGADLVFELSGNPDALNQAIAVAGYRGRIVIGSFYGAKRSRLALGTYFHRSGIRLISSQVSRILPEISGAWTKTRRLEVAIQMLKKINLSNLITHHVPVEKAQEAYSMLDSKPGKVIQILLTY